MVSAIAVAGRIGLTAIGDSPDEADALFQRVKSVFDAETGSPAPRRSEARDRPARPSSFALPQRSSPRDIQ